MVWLVMLRRVVVVSVLLGVSAVVCAVLVFGLSVDRLLGVLFGSGRVTVDG